MELEEDMHKKTYSGLIDLVFLMEQVTSRMQARFCGRSILVLLLDTAPSMLFLCSFLMFT
jgi:hypothetical protein